jgi:hypothetical protein
VTSDPSIKADAAEPTGDVLLHTFLQDRDVPCPLCGYNLRSLSGDRCPECGTGLLLQVGLTEPRLGSYITLLTACCTGLGGSLLFTLIALKAADSDWWHKPTALLLLGQLALTTLLLPLILKSRARFRRMPPSRQTFLAVALCVLVALFWISILGTFDR